MLPDSTRQIIEQNDVIIGDGRFSILGMRVVAIPLNIVLVLQKHFTDKHGRKASQVFYTAGRLQGRLSLATQLKLQNLPRDTLSLTRLLKISELFGYGALEIRECDREEGEAIFENSASPMCRQYVKLFGCDGSDAGCYMRGFCAGLIECLFGVHAEARETECAAKGTNGCRVVVRAKPGAGAQRRREDRLFNRIMEAFSPDRNLLSRQTAASKQLIAHGQISFRNGWFLAMSIPGVLFSVEVFAALVHLLDQAFGREVHDVLYQLGRCQTRMGGRAIMSRFEFNKATFLKSYVQQAELQGLGLARIDSIDWEKKVFCLEQTRNNLAAKHVELFGVEPAPVDSYTCGMAAGVGSLLFEIDGAGVETECIAAGSARCYYRVAAGEAGRRRLLLNPGLLREALSAQALLPAR